MTPDEIYDLGLSVGREVPAAYSQFMLNYPQVLVECGAADFECLADVSRVIALNRDLRNRTFYGLKWPDRLIAVGENGCGDFYGIDADGEHPGVIFFDHESRAFEPAASSMQEWVPILLAQYQEDDED